MSKKNPFLSRSGSKPSKLRFLTVSFIILLLLFPFVENVSFRFIDASFRRLKDAGVPDSVSEPLKSLENQEFAYKEDVLGAVEEQIGKEQTECYAKLILKCALKYGGVGQIILNTLMSTIFVFAIYAVSDTRKTVVIGLVLGLPWFFLSWIDLLITPLASFSLILALCSSASIIIFMAFTAIAILMFVVKAPHVNDDVLYGAVAIYMLLGGTWAMIFALLEELHFGSFAISAVHDLDGVVTWFDLLFYSFATLTTLGYGDIVPVTSQARSLAVVEAIIGVMYLAIIISRLVGMFIAKEEEYEENDLKK